MASFTGLFWYLNAAETGPQDATGQYAHSPSNAKQNFPPILQAINDANVTDPNLIVYLLATADIEDADNPGPEDPTNYPACNGLSAQQCFNMKYAFVNGNGDVSSGDGYNYRGRGYVQLTGKTNYQNPSSVVGQDLVANPDLASDPTIAAELLVNFVLTHGSSQYVSSNGADFYNARRVVNGLDKADKLSDLATQYAAALKNAGC